MRKRWLLIPLLISLCLVPGMAQEDPEPAPEPAQAAQAQAVEPEAQLRALSTLQLLGLLPEQAQTVLPLLKQAQERRRQRSEALDALWQGAAGSLQAVAGAMVAGREPDRRAVGAVAKTLEEHRAIMDQADRDLEKIGDQVLGRFDREQLGLVETAQQAAARAESLDRFDGELSLAHYLARYAVAMRGLLPEEYDALRVAMGLRLAERLVPADSRLFNQAVTDVLRIMDTVRRLTDAQFAQREEGLPQAVARALRLPEVAAEERAIGWREFMAFVTSPWSQTLVGKLARPGADGAPLAGAAEAEGEAAEGEETAVAADLRHPLTRALDHDANLVLVAELGLTNRQLLDLLTVARAAQQLVAERDQAAAQAVRRGRGVLDEVWKSLVAGEQPAVDAADKLALMREEREERQQRLLGAVGGQARLLRRTLAPEQARLVDWTTPAEAARMAAQDERLGELRVLAANLQQARQLIERIRYLIVSDYSTTRIGRVEDYLRSYRQPGTREFDEALAWTLRHIEEARVVKEEDWPQQAPVFAAQLLQRLGLLETQEEGREQTKYNWWDLYYLLTDPQTPGMVQAMVQARGNVAD